MCGDCAGVGCSLVSVADCLSQHISCVFGNLCYLLGCGLMSVADCAPQHIKTGRSESSRQLVALPKTFTALHTLSMLREMMLMERYYMAKNGMAKRKGSACEAVNPGKQCYGLQMGYQKSLETQFTSRCVLVCFFFPLSSSIVDLHIFPWHIWFSARGLLRTSRLFALEFRVCRYYG